MYFYLDIGLFFIGFYSVKFYFLQQKYNLNNDTGADPGHPLQPI